MMKKFELFLGHFGNGVSAANKAVEKDGEYKKIAHISDCGRITWYVSPHNIPADAENAIRLTAEKFREEWESRIERMGEHAAYQYLLDMVPDSAIAHFFSLPGTISEKLVVLKTSIMEIYG